MSGTRFEDLMKYHGWTERSFSPTRTKVGVATKFGTSTSTYLRTGNCSWLSVRHCRYEYDSATCKRRGNHVFSHGCLKDSLHRDIHRVKRHVVLEQGVRVAVPEVQGDPPVCILAATSAARWKLQSQQDALGVLEGARLLTALCGASPQLLIDRSRGLYSSQPRATLRALPLSVPPPAHASSPLKDTRVRAPRVPRAHAASQHPPSCVRRAVMAQARTLRCARTHTHLTRSA